VAKYVRKGLINVSPLKRGRVGAFPKNIGDTLKWAYASYLQLEQAEGKTQSSMKDMAKRVNACVNAAGYMKAGRFHSCFIMSHGCQPTPNNNRC